MTHVDSVRQVVTWSRENMELSGLEGVRWIVEDALKFVRREVRRGSLYRGIILDPPAYGRGAGGERWILEDNIGEMLECCAQLLEPRGAFLVLTLSRGMHWTMLVVIAASALAIWWLDWSPIWILAAAAALGIAWELTMAKKVKGER